MGDTFSSEVFLVDIHGTGELTEILCRWKFSDPSADTDTPCHFRCLDLFLRIHSETITSNHKEHESVNHTIPVAIETVLEDLVRQFHKIRESSCEEIAFKVIIVPFGGFLCRSDIIELRMRHSEFIESIMQFSSGNNYFPALTDISEKSFPLILSSSPGALLLKPSSKPYHESLRLLNEDLKVRLSSDWVVPIKPARRTVAIIGGRPAFDMTKGTFGHQGSFATAQALDIALIIVDQPGHWLESDEYSHLRLKFLGVDMTEDAGLPSRISETLKGELIDGIVTFSDEFVIATARAASMLDLPTEPVEAILRAHNKYETRELLSPNIQALRLEKGQKLDDPSMTKRLRGLRYPMIIKPCRGGGSRGVKRIDSYYNVQPAITELEKAGLSENGILIESYIDGPEVDANFVLWDGAVLFCETSDDFPCEADKTDATILDNFAETVMVLPSRLDPEELNIIQSTLHEGLLQLGFRSGVFHLEARMQNSSMRYAETDGVEDLVRKGARPKGRLEVVLIEVNARPPGLQSVFASLFTYGVDYCALQFLRALGDREQFTALSNTFSCRAQYWCEIVFIPVHRENILVPPDFCDDVLQRLPDIAPYVSRAECTASKKVVSPVGGTGFIGYFLLHSKASRNHMLAMGDRIKEVSRAVLDGFR